jgi:asparagine synthase (glutamine-hydrolysing)
VALTGTGGDELFGNYGKYGIYEKSAWYRWIKNVQQVVKQGLLREIRDGLLFPKGHFYHRYFSDAAKDRILCIENDRIPETRTEPYIEQVWKRAGVDDPRNAVAYVDFRLQLPEEFLLVTDRFSMAHSVEARVPFLDHTLVELVFRVPPSIRTRSEDPKYLLKEVMKGVLPDEILSARKRGFILPLHIWIKNDLRPLVEEMLSADYLIRQGIFSSRVCDRLIRPHLSGEHDYTQHIWTLLMFQLWYKVFLQEKRTFS